MHCLQIKKKAGKKLDFKKKRITKIHSFTKKNQKQREQKKTLFSCNSILRLAFWVLSCSPPNKHFFPKEKAPVDLGSPERISQRKLPGSIHWALSATTTCRFPNQSKVGWAEKSQDPNVGWLTLKDFHCLEKGSRKSTHWFEDIWFLQRKTPLCAVNINYNRHIFVSLRWCLTWVRISNNNRYIQTRWGRSYYTNTYVYIHIYIYVLYVYVFFSK